MEKQTSHYVRLASALLLLTGAAHAADRIGGIEFFGYTGKDIDAIRKALPVHVGGDYTGEARARIRQAIHTTDVASVCCDATGSTWVYIGLGGQAIRYLPKPTGQVRLSAEISKLAANHDQAIEAAVHKGGDSIQEDDSAGYALSHDPEARAIELMIRDYALQHEEELRKVLEESDNDDQRGMAAEALGYARQSPEQIAALVRACRDSNGDVRNNATRALGVLAESSAQAAAQIEPSLFIQMIRSGKWTDRNKASMVLMQLTTTGDPKLLEALKSQAMDALREIAAWKDEGHALAAQVILDRIDHLNKP